MKSWILSHKMLAIILACVLGAGVICAVVLPITLAHRHEFSAEWTTDENYHWHKCKGEKCNEVSDKASHVFDEEIVSEMYFASDATYTAAAKYYKSCICGVKGTETFSHGSPLSAKANTIAFADGLTLDKSYDGTAVVFDASQVNRYGDGAITIMYKVKGADDNTYIATAPKNVGEYTVKVSVEGTAEWKAASKTVDFAIAKKALKATATKTYDGTDTMPATLTGVLDGETVTATITMTSKNVGATVKEVMLAGADKDNYILTVANVTASITAKTLKATATKTYDGTDTMPATLTGVLDGDKVTATITMTSKNVGATAKEVMLAGADKDNYMLTVANVTASITPRTISVDWEHDYDNTSIFKGEPAELLKGDEATITVTMSSANVGSTVQSFKLTGKDAANYSLARKDVNVKIVKAKIKGFEISNASAFTKIFIGAKNIPEPTTNYVEIGTGYGEKTIVWRKQIEDGVWSRVLKKEEVIQSKTGTFQVSIQYAEGDNYKLGATPSVIFTMKAKPRNLTVRNFDGKTYDGKQVANFTYENLVYKLSTPSIEGGVENITPMTSGEKYVEFREVGGEWGRNLNVANVLTNAGEYEYRIGVTATDEWEEVVSDIKSFTIKPYEFVLKLGYIKDQQWQSADRGKTFLFGQYENLIEGQKIQLWLNNEKAGFETREGNNGVFYFITDQKKQVTTDCFFLKISNFVSANMENYKIVPKSPSVSTVEVTVVEHSTTQKSTSGPIQVVQPTEKSIYATVEKGYFQVGQTVEVYRKVIVGSSATYVKVGEATITEIRAGGTTSASGCAIPSDGRVVIVLDKIYDDILSGKIVAK